MTVPYDVAERIRLRKAQYCRFLDTKQWAAFRAIVADDFTGTFYNPDGTVFVHFDSPETLIEVTAPALDGGQSSHIVANAELEMISDTEVSAIWAMQDHLLTGPGTSLPFGMMHGYGHYHERWVARDGDWYLQTMDLVRTAVEYGPIIPPAAA